MVKVWDWMNKKLLHTLSDKSGDVSSICLTNDQSILFSGSVNEVIDEEKENTKSTFSKIVAWHTSNFKALFTLNFDNAIHSIRVSSDDHFLIALGADNKNASVFYSQILGDNLESTRIKISQRAYENIDIQITKNNKFLFILQDNKTIEVWNVESRVLDKILPTESKNCSLELTSDSKYLFHVTGDNEIT